MIERRGYWLVVPFTMLLGMALPPQAHAGTIDFSITGELGPLLSGKDPIGVSSHNFDFTGTMPTNLKPVSETADSATYELPDTVEVTLGKLTPVATNVMLTLTDPASGPDSLSLDFTATEFGYSPLISATMILPAGTLKGAGLQDLSAVFTQPDSSLSYTNIGISTVVEGTVGLSGTADFTGGSRPSNTPEPGTMALLASGLVAIFWKVRR